MPAAIERALVHGGEAIAPSREQLLESLLALYEDSLAFYDEGLGLRIARKHIAWTIDAVFGASARERRKTICMLVDPARVRAELQALFAEADERAPA